MFIWDWWQAKFTRDSSVDKSRVADTNEKASDAGKFVTSSRKVRTLEVAS